MLVAFPQCRPKISEGLQLRVVTTGRWPWASDGNPARFVPPPTWRRLGSRLTPSDALGAGIWSPANFLRIQIGFDAIEPSTPGDVR